jgi:hypothetical protein
VAGSIKEKQFKLSMILLKLLRLVEETSIPYGFPLYLSHSTTLALGYA